MTLPTMQEAAAEGRGSVDRPIIFSAVRALLDGRKTMTRLLAWKLSTKGGDHWRPSPWQRVKPGDRLWVKHAADLFPVYLKPIGFGDGKYAAGTDGHIYDVSGASPRKCKPQPAHRGHLRLSLRFQGEKLQTFVHSLVAEAFYGPAPSSLPECRHLNSDPTDNRPENLDWGTTAQNHQDLLATGRGRGEHRGAASKLTEQQVAALRTEKGTHDAIASRYGVSRSTVSLIKAGRRWSNEVVVQPPRNLPAFKLWRSPRYMPRWASTTTLIVTATKVERLQEVSEEDANHEGARILYGEPFDPNSALTNRRRFELLWRDLHGAAAWDANHEVVCLSFRVEVAA